MKKFLVIAAAAGTLAFGVPAALAATDSADTPADLSAARAERGARSSSADRDDCPEKDGRGGGEGSNAPSASEI